jgi:hypothetical protein
MSRGADLDAQPPQPAFAQRLRLREGEQAAAVVSAQVVQVRVHRVRAAAEVHVVRKIERRLRSVVLRHAQLVHEVAAQRVQLPVLLADLWEQTRAVRDASSRRRAHWRATPHAQTLAHLLGSNLVLAQVQLLRGTQRWRVHLSS